MKLFEIIPTHFFRLLSGPNRQLYVEAVMLLYDHAQKERFGIPINLMRDVLQELIESWHERGVDWQDEEEKVGGSEAEANPTSSLHTGTSNTAIQQDQLDVEDVSRAQANALLRRLEQFGWIETEVRDRFETFIVLPHYSVRMLALFEELCEGRAVEYQRYAFTTYGVLTGEEAKERPAMALNEAYNATLQFDRELFTLYNNMKHHMEQMVQKETIEEVLTHHFDEYQRQIVDSSYHRLKTSDHVSRYRLHILQAVQEWQLDRGKMEATIQDGLFSGFYENREEAEKEIVRALREIESIYAGLDDVFRQIDLRHNQYLRSSYDRARYLSQHQQGVSHRIAQFLEHLSQQINQLPEDKAVLPGLFRLHQLRTVTPSSLFPPRQKREPHKPEQHRTVPIPEEVRKQLREEQVERMRKAITRKKVDDFVMHRLGEREQMDMAELAPTSVEEFLYLTYVYLYGHDGGSSFRLKRRKDKSIINVGPYRFHNHRIERKRKG